MSVVDELVHCTVRLACRKKSGEVVCGTGYFVEFCENNNQCIPCIVTNKHVVVGAEIVSFNLTKAKPDGSASLGEHEQLDLPISSNICVMHPDETIDLAAIVVGQVLNRAGRQGTPYYLRTVSPKWIANDELLKSLTTMEAVIMIGYPTGLWDQTHNLPIVRRGVTATHPRLRLNNRSEFLIDAACFPGSSGSPVFLGNIGSYSTKDGSFVMGDQVALLGTLYAGPQFTTKGDIVVVNVPTETKPIAVGTIPTNLGLVVSASELTALEIAVKQQTQQVIGFPRNSLCSCASGKRFKDCCGKLPAN